MGKFEMLFATSNPQNSYLPFLETELKAIRNLDSFENHVIIHERSSIGFNSLIESIKVYKGISILHYSGHSNQDGVQTEKDKITPEAIATICDHCPNLRLIFLNSCCSEDIAKSIVAKYEEKNKPSPFIIGTESKVKDDFAAVVAYLFYEQLITKSTINQAFELAKASLINPSSVANVLKKLLSDATKQTNAIGKLEPIRGGLVTDEQANNGFPWIIKGGSPDDNWMLIPDHKQVLKNTSDPNTLKVLGLYQRKEEDAKYFQKIKNTYGNKGVVIHGVWDIFGDRPFNQVIFDEEFKAADAILHLIGSVDYAEASFKHVFDNSKNNAWLPLMTIDEDKIFSKNNAFKSFKRLTSQSPPFGNNLIDILSKVGQNLDLGLTLFDTSIKEFLNTNIINVEEVKQAFKELEFTEKNAFAATYRKHQDKISFNIITVGSSTECGCNLLVRQIIAWVSVLSNKQVIKLSLSEGHSVEDFWKQLTKALIGFEMQGDIEILKRMSIQILSNKLQLKNSGIKDDPNVYIVCEGFPSHLISELEMLFKELHLSSTNIAFDRRLLFFAIIHKEPITEEFKRLKGDLTTEFGKLEKLQNHYFEIIQPMIKEDIIKWKNKYTKYVEKIVIDQPISDDKVLEFFLSKNPRMKRIPFMKIVTMELKQNETILNDLITQYYD